MPYRLKSSNIFYDNLKVWQMLEGMSSNEEAKSKDLVNSYTNKLALY